MDSKLVVEQMSGRWQIKHADMRELAKKCRDAHPASLVTYSWIPRDENSHADRLANKALDGGQAEAPAVQIQENYLTDRLRSNEEPTMIYFVRHGETILTPFRKFSGVGPLDPELTEEGLEQAATVAQEIAKIKPDVLIASPLQRTRQTAEAIAAMTGLPIIFDDSHLVHGMVFQMMRFAKSFQMIIRPGLTPRHMHQEAESHTIRRAFG
jgi:probable phosphoglycerate mutase